LGFPVVEVGVEWSENREKSESKVKIFHDAAKMGLDLLIFRLNANDLQRGQRGLATESLLKPSYCSS
jgi:hypothetical protein